jgi:hypothetical protein
MSRLDPNRKAEWYQGRDPRKFADDLTKVFDFLTAWQSEKDRMQRAYHDLERKYKWLRATVITAIIGAVAQKLIEVWLK